MLEADVEVDRREFTVAVALAVAPGERLAVFGPSGAGKTTILEVIAGLLAPRRGRVVLGERVLTLLPGPRGRSLLVPPWRRGIGLLRQNPCLFPHLPVLDNLCYSVRERSAAGSGANGRGHGVQHEIQRVATALGICGLLDEMPARLSGGQAHRVALGRLLVARCDALLLDEPYTGLDAGLRRTLTRLVSEVATERGLPAILVSHELADAQAFASRLAVVDRGRLLQTGTPEEVVHRPACRRVAELVGYLGFVPVTTDSRHSTERRGPAGTVAGIHPDRMVAGAWPDAGLVITGVVEASRPAGAGWEADLRTPNGAALSCRLTRRPPGAGSPLTVTALDPPLFTPDGADAGRYCTMPRVEGTM
ncbi:ABC transporter ATP-binding protein [Mycobacterium sp. SM1]|uniref:ABC transporter ATP-binding protein n=1 Tax=Mycobacterium sp. SM1 TaxID=2816243 RepID=UPI001BCD3F00|nr:ABC transporter ATP-binding protein [Mycobacterium sp. SM1]MBS4728196.1 ABC transporter ATP-binding protein [Mycobacterium sp. SM1]